MGGRCSKRKATTAITAVASRTRTSSRELSMDKVHGKEVTRQESVCTASFYHIRLKEVRGLNKFSSEGEEGAAD
jgi:hypothetical protein